MDAAIVREQAEGEAAGVPLERACGAKAIAAPRVADGRGAAQLGDIEQDRVDRRADHLARPARLRGRLAGDMIREPVALGRRCKEFTVSVASTPERFAQ